MAVTPRTFFQPFVAAVFNGVHNFSSHTLKIALTNVEPVSTYANLSSISQIPAGGGYTTGGFAITTTTSSQSAGVYKLILQDYTLSATGAIAEWQYAVLYNDTAAGDPLIAWYTFAVPFNLASGDTFPFDFDGINGTLNFAPGGASSGSVTLAVAPSSVAEDGATDLVFTFTRAGIITAPLTVNYTIGGTAVNGADYVTIGTSVVIGAGNTSADVAVTPIDNADTDGDRTVSLQLAAGSGYTIGTAGAITGTIEDDDGFDPLTLSPLAWWDASDTATVTTSGGNVTEWADKSGNGWDVEQTDAADRPAYTSAAINGLAAVEWPSTNNRKFLIGASGTLTIQEVYFVIQYSNTTFSSFDGLLASNNDLDLWITGGNTGETNMQAGRYDFYYLNGDNTTNRAGDVFPEIQSPCLMRAYNATARTTGAGIVVGMDRTYYGLNRGWSGYIAEILVFDTALSTGDRTDLENYLMDKWGV